MKNQENKETTLIDFQFKSSQKENTKYHQVIEIKIRTNEENDLNFFFKSISNSFNQFLEMWKITSEYKIKVDIQKIINNQIESFITDMLDISNNQNISQKILKE